MAAIEERQYRNALGHYASGITIIGSIVEGRPVGFTCQAFCSVSLKPPLVSFSTMKASTSWPKIRSVRQFAINVLSAQQADLSRKFGLSREDRWANVSWKKSPHGNPLIEDALFWLDCSMVAEHEAGDHWIVVSRVERLAWPDDQKDRAPLIFYKGRYRQLAEMEDA